MGVNLITFIAKIQDMRYGAIPNMRNGALLTGLAAAATTHRVGRKLEWPEKFLASFAAGTLARVEAALRPGEDKRSLLREAVERELKRRDREAKR